MSYITFLLECNQDSDCSGDDKKCNTNNVCECIPGFGLDGNECSGTVKTSSLSP